MPKLPWLSPTRLVLLIALVAIGYLSFTAVSTLVRSHRLSADERRLEREIAQLQTDDQRLDAIQEYLRSDEYVEAIARRLLGLVRPGETLVVVSSTATDGPTPEATPARAERPGHQPRWWERLFGP